MQLVFVQHSFTGSLSIRSVAAFPCHVQRRTARVDQPPALGAGGPGRPAGGQPRADAGGGLQGAERLLCAGGGRCTAAAARGQLCGRAARLCFFHVQTLQKYLHVINCFVHMMHAYQVARPSVAAPMGLQGTAPPTTVPMCSTGSWRLWPTPFPSRRSCFGCLSCAASRRPGWLGAGRAPFGMGGLLVIQVLVILGSVYRQCVFAQTSTTTRFSGLRDVALAQLQPHVQALLPRLFRGQNDPNTRIKEVSICPLSLPTCNSCLPHHDTQHRILCNNRLFLGPYHPQAMAHLWRSLVPEPRAAVDAHFDAITTAVLSDMGSRSTRVRESATVALGDLLQGRSWTQLQRHLEAMWAMCFRALDDVTEQVRGAALTCFQTLRNVTLRLADPSLSPSAAAEALGVGVRVMLQQGRV